jgi:TonB family protein
MTPLRDTVDASNQSSSNQVSGHHVGEHQGSSDDVAAHPAVAAQVADAPASASAAQPHAGNGAGDPGQLRADAVSLEVAVKVHGSRIIEVVRGVTPHTEPFEENASTMIVFAQGGVLKMFTALTPGQMVILTNVKTGQDAISRVIKVRAFTNAKHYVEVEFTHRQPGYWGVHFPSDDLDAPLKVPAEFGADSSVHAPKLDESKLDEAADSATHERAEAPAQPPPINANLIVAPPSLVNVAPASPAAASPASISPAPVNSAPVSAPPASPSPISMSSAVAPSKKPESSKFVSIGSQEEVQLAASPTRQSLAVTSIDAERSARPAAPPAKIAGIASGGVAPHASSSHAPSSHQISAPSPFASIAEIKLDAPPVAQRPPAVVQLPQNAEPVAFIGDLHVQAQPLESSRPAFDPMLESSAAISGVSGESRANLIPIAAAAVIAVAGILGAAFYFHSRPNSERALADVAAASQPVQSPADAGSAAANAARPVIDPPPLIVKGTDSIVVNGNASSAAAAVAANTPSKQKTAGVVSDLFGTLNAHPVSSAQRQAVRAAEAVPAVDSGAPAVAESAPGVDNGALAGISSSPLAPLAPAGAGPAMPVRVGGDVKPPRVIYSLQPEYPDIARLTNVEGTVVLDAVVDTAGNVVNARVISGPALLRKPALDSVKQWKYEPSKLDGQPTSVEVVVSIQFKR